MKLSWFPGRHHKVLYWNPSSYGGIFFTWKLLHPHGLEPGVPPSPPQRRTDDDPRSGRLSVPDPKAISQGKGKKGKGRSSSSGKAPSPHGPPAPPAGPHGRIMAVCRLTSASCTSPAGAYLGRQSAGSGQRPQTYLPTIPFFSSRDYRASAPQSASRS